ncbi:MAG: mocA [Verrucomicrobiaceae bacterium]|nr:mocA [Verrucomicrobiaceae bacterium]
MPLNHYVTLGRSGLRVSPICLGTMTFGEELGWGSTVADSERILDRYMDQGGNFIDTANFYTHGHSEKIIGDHLGKNRAKRHSAVIATKFFANMRVGDPNAGGAGRKNIYWACEESLRRLQTDYIDLYWMHAWDQHTPIDETLRALDDLVSAGKIRYIGFSDTPAWKVAHAQTLAHFKNWAPLIALQMEYSLLERTIEGDMTPLAQEFGLGITPWSPLRSGVLTGKYRRDQAAPADALRTVFTSAMLDEKAHTVVDVLREIADELDTMPARIALQWVIAQPAITSTIIGARTLQQLDDNIAALDLKLSADQLQRLNALTEPVKTFPASILPRLQSFQHSGTTINGVEAPRSPMSPEEGKGY